MVFVSVIAANFVAHPEKRATTLVQVLIVGASIWSGLGGLSTQHRMLRSAGRAQDISNKGTAFTRWRAGHLIRLWSTVAVGLWGLVLREVGGSHVLADLIFTTSLLLLFFWKPGPVPAETNSQPMQ